MFFSRKLLLNQLSQGSKLLNRKSGSYFSRIAELNFRDAIPILRVEKNEGEFTFSHVNQSHENILFEANSHILIKDLIANVENKFPGLFLSAYSLEQAEIPPNETLEGIGKSNFYLISKDHKTIYRVVHKGKEDDQYRNLEILLQDLRLSVVERQVILNYLKRLDILNELNLKEKVFIDGKDLNAQVDRNIFQKNLVEALVYNKNIEVGGETSLYQEYVQVNLALLEKETQKDILSKAALKKAKRKMLLGLGCLVGQFVIIGWGTYVTYSWDIMEPICYFMTLTGSIVLSAQYFKNYEGYSNTGFLNYLKEKELLKICKQVGFNLEEIENLRETRKALELKIKSNIIADL